MELQGTAKEKDELLGEMCIARSNGELLGVMVCC